MGFFPDPERMTHIQIQKMIAQWTDVCPVNLSLVWWSLWKIWDQKKIGLWTDVISVNLSLVWCSLWKTFSTLSTNDKDWRSRYSTTHCGCHDCCSQPGPGDSDLSKIPGVTLQSDLGWENHTDKICSRWTGCSSSWEETWKLPWPLSTNSTTKLWSDLSVNTQVQYGTLTAASTSPVLGHFRYSETPEKGTRFCLGHAGITEVFETFPSISWNCQPFTPNTGPHHFLCSQNIDWTSKHVWGALTRSLWYKWFGCHTDYRNSTFSSPIESDWSEWLPDAV